MKREWPRSSEQCRHRRLSRANARGRDRLAPVCAGIMVLRGRSAEVVRGNFTGR